MNLKRWTICFGLTLVCACGGKDDGKNQDTEEEKIEAASSTLLTLSLPSDLAMDSPFNAETPKLAATANSEYEGAQGTLELPPALRLQADPVQSSDENGPKGPAERRAQLGRILYEAQTLKECFYREQPAGSLSLSCYGPSLAYNNHPDDPVSMDWGTDFTIPGRTFIGGGDIGIFEPTTESGEACISAKMNGAIGMISATVNNAIGYMAMVTCVARVTDNKKLPGQGEVVDLGGYLEKLTDVVDTGFGATIASFKIGNLSQEGSDKSTYETSMTYTVKDSMNPNPLKVSLTLSHSASDLLSGAYEGSLKIVKQPEDLDTNRKCGQGDSRSSKQALSVHYKKNEDGIISYESRTGGWLPSVDDKDMFDGLSYAKTPSAQDCNLGGTFTVSQINAKSGEGKVAHAWIAGQGAELTRSFVAEVKSEGEGDSQKKEGCGYFGFGPTMDQLIAKRDGDLPADRKLTFIDKFTCNWSQFNHGRQYDKQLVQKQCMSQNEQGVFTPVSNNISFSPQNDCAAGPNSDFELFKQVNNVWTQITPAETTDLISISDTAGDDLKSPEIP